MQLKSAASAAVLACVALQSSGARADVLPDDRTDVQGSHYIGGGQDINGTSILVRKKVDDHVSLAYSHVTDVVSGASIDVRTSGASPYREARNQDGLRADILFGKVTYGVGFSHSAEPDYVSNTANFSISESMFGDLTTVSMSYRRTWNDVYKMLCNERAEDDSCVGKIHDPAFGRKTMDERSYGLGLSQVLTRNSIIGLNFEAITDQGWLSNPYRSVLYADPNLGLGYGLTPEVDPSTRTSYAVSLDYKYYLPWRAALDGQYRYYGDTWKIRSNTIQLGYTQPWRHWTFDGSVRYYTQTAASFYSDLFSSADQQNFMSRNRELSDFDSLTIGVGATYQFTMPYAKWIQKSTANFRFDHFIFDYKDFRNALLIDPANGVVAGEEPLYKLQLNVMQLFLSVWY